MTKLSYTILHWTGTGDYIVLGVVLIFAAYIIMLSFRERRRHTP